MTRKENSATGLKKRKKKKKGVSRGFQGEKPVLKGEVLNLGRLEPSRAELS